MNVIDSPSSTAAAHDHWLPSHVQITIHQAKDLHLKNKSGHSELYVSLQVNKEQFVTGSLPKQLLPHWNQVFVIPLMSLASTIHITVRQKGRFGDSYLGYIAINPGSFKINPTPTTHWYKLGCKPGKNNNTKLRGDLQVTFQFLSKWSSSINNGSGRHGGMLQRSLSDLKLRDGAMGRTGSDSVLMPGKENQPKVKKELLANLRRSFRRKKSPVFKNCDDDFASFASHSASSTPQIIRKETSSTSIPAAETTGSNSLSSTSNGMSDSDTGNSVSQTPPPTRTGAGRKNCEGEDVTVVTSPEQEDSKMPSANKFHNFKSKKRPWNMPVSPSPSSPPEKSLGSQTQVFPEEPEEEAAVDCTKTSQPEEPGRRVSTFRYKSRADVLSRSFRGHDSAAARFAARQKREQEMNSLESGASLSTDDAGGSSASVEGESVGGRPGSAGQHSATGSGSRDSSACTSAEGSRTELNMGAGGGEESAATKTPPIKSHPYSRRINITPTTSSPQRTRPKILAYGKTDVDIVRKSKTGPAMLARRSTLASIPMGKRLLPATPMRRGSRTPSSSHSITTPSGDEISEPQSAAPTPVTGSSQNVSVLPSKMEKLLDHAGIPKSEEVDGHVGSSEAELPAKPHPPRTTSSESLSSLDAKEEPPPSPKVKHTVQYKNSALGFQPATLLPPSLSGPTHYHSYTLPTRTGKISRHHSESSKSLVTDNGLKKSPSLTKLSRVPDHSPPNTRYTPQALLSQMAQKTPPPKTPSSSTSSPGGIAVETASETTDGAGNTGDEASTDRSRASPSPALKYGGKTPGEIVTSALRNRRPSGALKKAMSMYHESRKQSQSGPKTASTEEGRRHSGLWLTPPGDGPGRGHMAEPVNDATSSSARSSPMLVRSNSRNGSISNLFSSLRRTGSLIFTSSSKTRTKSAEDVSSEHQDQSDSTHLCNGFVSNVPAGLQNTSAPGLLMRVQERLARPPSLQPSLQDEEGEAGEETVARGTEVRGEGAVVEENESPMPQDEEGEGASEVLIRVRTATMTSADSSSLHTLTDRGEAAAEPVDVVREQRFSPNPAGAASAASSSHVRHTTCGSVESEGFHSVTSEEGNMEDLVQQDFSQWSREDLVKELMSCKDRLSNTEEQLREVKNYMETLLVRIMDTNPSILSSHP